MKKLLLLDLAIIGTIWPMLHFYSFLSAEGFSIGAAVGAIGANQLSLGALADLVISSFAFWMFLYIEGRRRKMRNLWLYVVANLFVGLSLALPLFLFMRERRLEESSVGVLQTAFDG